MGVNLEFMLVMYYIHFIPFNIDVDDFFTLKFHNTVYYYLYEYYVVEKLPLVNRYLLFVSYE